MASIQRVGDTEYGRHAADKPALARAETLQFRRIELAGLFAMAARGERDHFDFGWFEAQ